MYKVYVVCWGHAGIDDRGNSTAFSNVYGVYRTAEEAQCGLVACRDEFIDEIINNPDFDEFDKQCARDNLKVYGSVDEGYFELDYDNCDIVEETYLTIVEKEVL